MTPKAPGIPARGAILATLSDALGAFIAITHSRVEDYRACARARALIGVLPPGLPSGFVAEPLAPRDAQVFLQSAVAQEAFRAGKMREVWAVMTNAVAQLGESISSPPQLWELVAHATEVAVVQRVKAVLADAAAPKTAAEGGFSTVDMTRHFGLLYRYVPNLRGTDAAGVNHSPLAALALQADGVSALLQRALQDTAAALKEWTASGPSSREAHGAGPEDIKQIIEDVRCDAQYARALLEYVGELEKRLSTSAEAMARAEAPVAPPTPVRAPDTVFASGSSVMPSPAAAAPVQASPSSKPRRSAASAAAAAAQPGLTVLEKRSDLNAEAFYAGGEIDIPERIFVEDPAYQRTSPPVTVQRSSSPSTMQVEEEPNLGEEAAKMSSSGAGGSSSLMLAAPSTRRPTAVRIVDVAAPRSRAAGHGKTPRLQTEAQRTPSSPSLVLSATKNQNLESARHASPSRASVVQKRSPRAVAAAVPASAPKSPQVAAAAAAPSRSPRSDQKPAVASIARHPMSIPVRLASIKPGVVPATVSSGHLEENANPSVSKHSSPTPPSLALPQNLQRSLPQESPAETFSTSPKPTPAMVASLGPELAQRFSNAKDSALVANQWLSGIKLSPLAAEILSKHNLEPSRAPEYGARSPASALAAPSGDGSLTAASATPAPSIIRSAAESWLTANRTSILASTSDATGAGIVAATLRFPSSPRPALNALDAISTASLSPVRLKDSRDFFSSQSPLGKAMADAVFSSRLRSLTREALLPPRKMTPLLGHSPLGTSLQMSTSSSSQVSPFPSPKAYQQIFFPPSRARSPEGGAKLFVDKDALSSNAERARSSSSGGGLPSTSALANFLASSSSSFAPTA